MTEIRHITAGDTRDLESFLASAGRSLETFRYFSKRPLGILRNHLVTMLAYHNGHPVAYGHLDKDSGTVWLGIAVAENAGGKGFGRRVMEELIGFAITNGIEKVRLSVDRSNERAIALYRRYRFRPLKYEDGITFFEWHRPRLYVSTLAFAGQDVRSIVETAEKSGFAIEFSSGMPYSPDLEQIYLSAGIPRIPHNYFPPPADPFVINLASGNERIRTRSVEHCKKGLGLAKAAGAGFFSAHAGFCIDPRPDQLGRPLDVNVAFDRQLHWKIFISSVGEVADFAASEGMAFLVENNVTARFNLTSDNVNPLFCSDPEEMLRMLSTAGRDNLGLLLDTAHLKVSAATLGFDADDACKKVANAVACVHHSDNDGETDSNGPVGAGYWFLQHMHLYRNADHVLEVKARQGEGVSAQLDLLRKQLIK